MTDQWLFSFVSCNRYQTSVPTTVNKSHNPRPDANLQEKGISGGAVEGRSFGSGPERRRTSPQTKRRQMARTVTPRGSCQFKIASTPSFAATAVRIKVRPTLHRNAIKIPQRTITILHVRDARYSSPRNNDTMSVA